MWVTHGAIMFPLVETGHVTTITVLAYIYMTDRQTDRQTGVQTDRQTDIQTYRHTDRQTDIHTDKTNRQTDRHTQTDRQTDRQTDQVSLAPPMYRILYNVLKICQCCVKTCSSE